MSKPTLDNFINPIVIVKNKEDLDNLLKEAYKSLSFSYRIRVKLFNLLFKNKPLYGKTDEKLGWMLSVMHYYYNKFCKGFRRK